MVGPRQPGHHGQTAVDQPRSPQDIHLGLPGMAEGLPGQDFLDARLLCFFFRFSELCFFFHVVVFCKGLATCAMLQDDERGGISDRPDDMADVFHTFFGIAGA